MNVRNSAQSKYGKNEHNSKMLWTKQNKEQLAANHADWALKAYPTQRHAQLAPC